MYHKFVRKEEQIMEKLESTINAVFSNVENVQNTKTIQHKAQSSASSNCPGSISIAESWPSSSACLWKPLDLSERSGTTQKRVFNVAILLYIWLLKLVKLCIGKPPCLAEDQRTLQDSFCRDKYINQILNILLTLYIF